MSSRKARESSTYTWLYTGTRHMRPELHLCRVENICERGTPDVEGCWRGGPFQVELKAIARGRGELETGVSSDQVNWHRSRYLAGGLSYILIQVGSGRGASRYLVRGSIAAAVVRATEKELRDLALLPPAATAVEVVECLAKRAQK